MSPLVRSLFPSAASFGPLFMVIGLTGPESPVTGGLVLWSTIFALIGALATGMAMLVLYKQQIRIIERLDGSTESALRRGAVEPP